MKAIARIVALLCLVALAGAAGAQEAVIGSVVRLQGSCSASSGGVAESVVVGAAVRLNETMTTGAEARLELAFDDGTHLTIGENARVVLDSFVYQPAGASLLHAAVTGPFRFVSGKLAANATRQASVTTPFAVIGVRGTEFWGGPIDGAYGVFLLEGAVSVSGGGQQTLLQAPGASVDVAGIGAPPGAATVWPAEKIARAIATVTFQ